MSSASAPRVEDAKEEDKLLDENAPKDVDLKDTAAMAKVDSSKVPLDSTSGDAVAGASSAQPSEKPSSNLLPIVFWIACSGAVILFNKLLYNGPFRYPLTLTTVHMISATVVTSAMRLTGLLSVPQLGWGFFFRSIVPIGVLYSMSLGFSNLAAARLSVSFVQMIKALMPMATLGVGVLTGLDKPSFRQAIIIALLVAGVLIASYGELLWNTQGVMYQGLSVLSESWRLVITQKLLQQHLPKGSSPLVSIAMFAPPSALLLLPVAIFREPGSFSLLLEPSLARLIGANTVVAFTLNIAVVLVVGRTSGLTLTLAGVVKDIMLIVLSILAFGNPVTSTQVGGYFVALYGLNLHDVYKADKDAPMAALAKTAATNKRMLLIALGVAVVFFIARNATVQASTVWLKRAL